MSPFEALYGKRPKNSIDSLKLPASVVQKLKAEEDLEALLAGRTLGTTHMVEEEERRSSLQSGIIVWKIVFLDCVTSQHQY